MPSTDWSTKRKRQYQHIKNSVVARGERVPLAEGIAAPLPGLGLRVTRC